MRHSRSISDLRADVAENCRALLMLAEREGLSVLVTETVRDAEYQRMLAEKGYAAKGAGGGDGEKGNGQGVVSEHRGRAG